MGAVKKAAGTLSCAALIGAGSIIAATPANAAAAKATPCGPQAAACVQLSTNSAWLPKTGYGPVTMSSGMPGYETPVGTFNVTRKEKDSWSKPYNAPMPYAVYFTSDGVAFHEGDTNRESHGCVRLGHDAAVTFFNNLQPGDVVQVVS